MAMTRRHHREHPLRNRPALPAGRRRLLAVPPRMGHEYLDAQDPAGLPLVGVKATTRHKAKISTPYGCVPASRRIERDGRKPLVARFGGIPLRRRRSATVTDRQPIRVDYPHEELSRLRGRLRDLPATERGASAPSARSPTSPHRTTATGMATSMANRRRKTLVLATAVMNESTPGSQPQHSRHSHWRAG
jgi:hypothetical protein